MRKITALFFTLLLTGCVHKMNVEQGNVIESENFNKLHTGMSKEQVQNLLGTPVLINTFRNNQVDYVYTNKPGYGKGVEKNFVLVFQGNRLKSISPLREQEFGK